MQELKRLKKDATTAAARLGLDISKPIWPQFARLRLAKKRYGDLTVAERQAGAAVRLLLDAEEYLGRGLEQRVRDLRKRLREATRTIA